MVFTAHTAKRWLGNGGHAGILAVFVLFAAFPFYWMLITTFKQTNDLLNVQNNPFLFNDPPTLENLRVLFEQTQYAEWLWNTLVVGVLVVLITLLLAIPAGYSLARLAGRWGQRMGIAIFLTYLIPPTILFIPFSRVIGVLGLQDSMWSLVLVYGLFQGHPSGPGGGGDDRRVQPPGGVCAGGDAPLFLGDDHGDHLRLRPGDAGVRLRPHLHHLLFPLYGQRGGAHLPGARRRVLLGLADGGLLHRQRAHRHRVQPVPGPHDRRVHRGGHQVTR
jgi:hypothetical protein